MNEFQQVSSEVQSPVSYHDRVGGGLYSEGQCIMSNGHMGPPIDRQTHTRVKTLPSLTPGKYTIRLLQNVALDITMQ